MSPEYRTVENEEDEVVVVTLSRRDYLIIREIIEERRSLNWLGKWFRNFAFVAVGGFLSFLALGDWFGEWFKHTIITRFFNG